MFLAFIVRFIMRHRYSLQDLTVIGAALSVAAYLGFEIDVFVHQGRLSSEEKTLELDEALLLGTLLTLSMFGFSLRRYFDQKREIRGRIEAERHVRSLAFEDQLTGLPNRRQFDETLHAALGETPAAGGSHALLLLDLNGFKRINDVYGHGTGDQALIAVAGRLKGVMRSGDLVARFGGDEFAIVLRHITDPETATTIALRVIEALKTPIRIGKVSHDIGTGIGIALFPQNADDTEELLRKADVALYRAKVERRSAMRFFDEDMDRQVNERAELEHALRQALNEARITTVFRPVLDIRTHQVRAFEAEPRWLTDQGQAVPPERFLAIAEEIGLIHDIAALTLSQACDAAVQWPREVRLSIDLYPAQLNESALPLRIASALMTRGLSADRLEVRLPETTFVSETDAAISLLQALRAAGVSVTLSHFGAGYSTLSQLRRFKPDRIKLDRGVTDAAARDSDGRAVANALIGLGRGLGLAVVADGVGSLDEAGALMSEGCALVQGETYGDFMTDAEARNLLQDAA